MSQAGRKIIGLPELAISVPSWETLSKIDLSPVDAVYLGQPYCLKTKGNLLTDIDGLRRSIETLKSAGKRAYLATPAIPKGRDFTLIAMAIRTAVEAGADAIEAHDVGVFRYLREAYRGLPVHVGSFANIYSQRTAVVFGKLGATRVMPIHELTLEERRAFRNLGGLQIEHTIQGKLPVGMAHSCLLRGKSLGSPGAGRTYAGEELGPCRQQCGERHLFEFRDWRMRCAGTVNTSAEDLMMVEYLPEILALRHDALRLETVLDSPAKISALARIYRKGIEAAIEGSSSTLSKLADEARDLSEDGVMNGWFLGRSGREYADKPVPLQSGETEEDDWLDELSAAALQAGELR